LIVKQFLLMSIMLKAGTWTSTKQWR